MPTSKDNSGRDGEKVFRTWFRHWRTGRIIRASDYGRKAFVWPKRPKRK